MACITNVRTMLLAGLMAACGSGGSDGDPPSSTGGGNANDSTSAADGNTASSSDGSDGGATATMSVTGASANTSTGGEQGQQANAQGGAGGGTGTSTAANSDTSSGGMSSSSTAGSSTGGSSTDGGSTGGSGGGDGVPSPGCSAGSAESGRLTIDVAGTSREFILELPQDYAASRPYPLVFAWHGLMYSADWVAAGDEPASGPYYGLLAAANGNAIFVAPQALSGGWSNQDGRDIAFVDAMLEHIKTQTCIDESRVFSVGFSFGAIMTLNIACERAAEFRAVAPMSGRLPDACPDADQPLAYWGAHGDADETITLSEGESVRAHFLERNQCASGSEPTDPDGCQSYQGCAAGAPVTFCVFSGEHVPAPFSGEGAWNFFAQF